MLSTPSAKSPRKNNKENESCECLCPGLKGAPFSHRGVSATSFQHLWLSCPQFHRAYSQPEITTGSCLGREMTRLVSSRIHRCYSRSGGQRSARNERLTDIVHLLSCVLLLCKRNAGFFKTSFVSNIAEVTGGLGIALLILANLIDLQASTVAHHMFYRWSKPGGKVDTFLSTPTRVDAVISLFYLIGGALMATSTASPLKSIENVLLKQAGTIGALTILMGTVLNVVASLPSLDFIVPAPMARAQNTVVTLFLLGAVTRLYSAVLASAPLLKTTDLKLITAWSSMISDSLVLCGAVLNLLRVANLLRRVQHWMTDGSRTEGAKSRRGILSWFKSNKSSNEMSDFDSDAEDHGADSEEDNVHPSSRRAGWART